MSMILALHYTKDQCVTKYAFWIIFLTGLSQATIGILHHYLFPEIVTGISAYDAHKLFYVDAVSGRSALSRESGSIGSSFHYSTMICVSSYLLCKNRINLKEFPAGMNQVLHVLLSAVLFVGVVLSLGRLPVVFAQVFIFLTPLALFLLPIGLYFVVRECPQFLPRFLHEGYFNRSQPNKMILNHCVSNIKIFILGTPVDIKNLLRTPEKFGFGDNSYLELASNSGVIILAWFANLAIFYKKYFMRGYIADTMFLLFVLINNWISEPYTSEAWNLFWATAIVLPPLAPQTPATWGGLLAYIREIKLNKLCLANGDRK
jgi:hypothetical protein